MEDIAPSLVLLWDVLWALERGLPVTFGIQSYLKRHEVEAKKNPFGCFIQKWWNNRRNQLAQVSRFENDSLSATRRQLLSIIELGLRGESILPQLRALEAEMILSCEDEIQAHAALLPLKMMVPLFALIFPSFFIILIVPLLRMLQF